MTTTLPPHDDSGGKSEVWNRVLKAALAMPGARIDRTSFLRKALSPHFSDDIVQKAIENAQLATLEQPDHPTLGMPLVTRLTRTRTVHKSTLGRLPRIVRFFSHLTT